MAVVTGAALAASVFAASWTPAIAGHEVGFYPSYYPHEIRLETLEPARAATLFAEKTLHAYIGAVPGDAERLPDDVQAVASLGSFVVLGFNPDSPVFGSGEDR